MPAARQLAPAPGTKQQAPAKKTPALEIPAPAQTAPAAKGPAASQQDGPSAATPKTTTPDRIRVPGTHQAQSAKSLASPTQAVACPSNLCQDKGKGRMVVEVVIDGEAEDEREEDKVEEDIV